MQLPQSSDYADAIQNPRSAFLDDELKNGKNDGPQLLGTAGPVASGNFAIVYRFLCGTKRYAVKCFTRQPPADQNQRFLSIHKHLQSSKLKCATDFQFIEQGIRVRGTLFPILKMEWLEAPTLLEFLPKQVNSPDVYRHLSEAFLTLCKELQNNSVAHGDFQHGNILVFNGALKLIDYDGMCVPGTNGLPSQEDGLPHYQHPARSGGRLATYFDNFPSLNIWISLYALSIAPSLWSQYVREDERLLFSKSDFLSPDRSPLFRDLLAYGDPRLTKAVNILRNACLNPNWATVPPITEVVESTSEVVAHDWWKEHAPSSGSGPKDTSSKSGKPEWMREEMQPLRLAHFGASVRRDTFLLYAYCLTAIAGGIAWFANILDTPLLVIASLGMGATVTGFIFAHYMDSPIREQKKAKTHALSESRICLLKARNEMAAWQKTQEAALEAETAPIIIKENRMQELRLKEQEVKRQCESQLLAAIQLLSQERLQIDSAEQRALQACNQKIRDSELQIKVHIQQLEQEAQRFKRGIDDKIAAIQRDMDAQLHVQLKQLQDSFVNEDLMKRSIRVDVVISLTPTNLTELHARGFYHASDFVSCETSSRSGSQYSEFVLVRPNGARVKVPGIGEKRANELVDWRQQCAFSALQRAPKKLPKSVIEQVERKYEQTSAPYKAQRDQVFPECERLKCVAQEAHAKELKLLPAKTSEVKALALVQRENLQQRETRARQDYEERKNTQLAPISRAIWQLQSLMNPAKVAVSQREEAHRRATALKMLELDKLTAQVTALEREVHSFAGIRLSKYLASVLGFTKV